MAHIGHIITFRYIYLIRMGHTGHRTLYEYRPPWKHFLLKGQNGFSLTFGLPTPYLAFNAEGAGRISFSFICVFVMCMPQTVRLLHFPAQDN